MSAQVWSETQASTAATAQTLTHAAETGRTHIVTGLIISYSVAVGPITLWELRDGDGSGTVVASGGGPVTWNGGPENPLCAKFTRGNGASIVVAAGPATAVSRVVLIGITV